MLMWPVIRGHHAPLQWSLSYTLLHLRFPLQIFMHKSAMQLHPREAHRNDVKPHQCGQCMKAFSSNHQLVQHIRVHTGEKPYKCSYCDRRFKQLSHVQQHTRLHTGEEYSSGLRRVSVSKRYRVFQRTTVRKKSILVVWSTVRRRIQLSRIIFRHIQWSCRSDQ